MTYGGRDDALEQAVEAKAAEELSDEVEHASEEQADTSDDLGEGLAEGVEEGAEILLGLGERVEFVFGPLDGAPDLLDEDLECLCETLLLGSGLVVLLVALGPVGDLVVGVGAFNGAVGLVQDLLGLLDERLDLLDELFLITVLFFAFHHVLDVLSQKSVMKLVRVQYV
jgi:hypothetical protein